MCPSGQRRWIGRERRIFAVRACLLNGIGGGDAFTGLLSAMQAERRRRTEPIGQDREGLSARVTDSAPHPNAICIRVVGDSPECRSNPKCPSISARVPEIAVPKPDTEYAYTGKP